MSLESYDFIQSFVEDCREHLDSIEGALLDMEAAGGRQNLELVNSVFRLAHSIKGGAGMLGLDNIKTLAHKLENVLHMVRIQELVPTHAVVGVLLRGFDRLTALVDNIHDSENMPIEAEVERLLAISAQAAGGRETDVAPAQFEVGGAGVFSVDALSLAQSRSGGNELYLLEFDLIHDIHGKGRMPLEVLKALADTGRIVDCKVDLAAVGDLDGFGNAIPFYVLYATILEPKYVSGLVKLPNERVRHIDSVPNAARVSQSENSLLQFGALELCVAQGAGRLKLPGEMTLPLLQNLQSALLAGLERCTAVVLDWSALTRCDVFFYQLLLAAQSSYVKRSKLLAVAGPLPDAVRPACVLQGFGSADDPGCMLPLA